MNVESHIKAKLKYNVKELFVYNRNETNPMIKDGLIENGWKCVNGLNSLSKTDHNRLYELFKLISSHKSNNMTV
jgi:hypothetical protein